MKKNDERLKDYLLENKLVSPSQLSAAGMESDITDFGLGQTMVMSGFIGQDELIRAMIAVTDESLFEEELILPHVPPEILIETKTKFVAQTIEAVYISTLGFEEEVAYRLRPFFGDLEFRFTPANAEDIEDYLDKISNINDSDSTVLETLVRNAIAGDVSDIHIEPKLHSYSVHYRYLGERGLIHEGDLEEFTHLVAQIKDRSGIDIAQRRIPMDGAFSMSFNGRIVDLRVATVPMPEGEKVTIRILDPAKANNKITSLGISNIKGWRDGTSRSAGLCLICGPTGSGKTTTLNATIRSLDPFRKSIYTLEDPVEYSIPFVNQIQINNAVGLTFARGIKACMRSDPDIIVVGEVRDEETARNMVKAAETGHLVIATLHTETIRGAVNRLRDIGVEKYELQSIIRSIMAQKLMKVRCSSCDGRDESCTSCGGSGYSSRTIISEAHYFPDLESVDKLLNTDEILWETQIEDAYNKYRRGAADFEEMFRLFGIEGVKIIEAKGFNDYDKARLDSGELSLEVFG